MILRKGKNHTHSHTHTHTHTPPSYMASYPPDESFSSQLPVAVAAPPSCTFPHHQTLVLTYTNNIHMSVSTHAIGHQARQGKQAGRKGGHPVCTRDAVSALFPTMSSISLPSSRTVPKGKDSGRK